MKMQEFRKRLGSRNIDSCILTNEDPNIKYLSGIKLEQCALIIREKSDPFFIIHELEKERVLKYSKIKKVMEYRTAKEKNDILKEAISGKCIGINKTRMTISELELINILKPNMRTEDVNEILTELRQVKTDEEISRIREACEISDKILRKLTCQFDFKTESQLRDFIEHEARIQGKKLSFDPIIASGQNASIPHYSYCEGKLGGFCILDFGIENEGYCSDITRTFFVGKPGKQDIMCYNAVRKAMEESLKHVKEGAEAGLIDSAARRSLGMHEKNFIHGLGHHIGVQVHDPGFRISPGSKGILKENMVVTIEPGIYLPSKLGIRIEDDILVKKAGFEALNKFTKELILF
ncbi:aminopeptidase P family protein [Candidatus Woesearchaeota archaeon]|nr:aminopeptidase P family protein [Candidatus Woesearchaeota archaeon]